MSTTQFTRSSRQPVPKAPEGPSARRSPARQLETPDLAQLQRATQDPAQARPADILALQRTAGNRAVSRLIQAKMTVGASGDRYEREADRVADQVLNMRSAREGQAMGSRPPQAGGGPAVQRQGEEEEIQTKPLASTITRIGAGGCVACQGEEEEVQTKSAAQRNADGGLNVRPGLEQHLTTHRGGGNPLPAETRAYMEPRFGADFSDVRLHTGADAVQLNRELNAQAFTNGRDIYLGERTADLKSEGGRKLIAHELTHVVQQAANPNRIARWGVGPPWSKKKGTSHTDLTNEAIADLDADVSDSYGAAAIKYLAEHSDHMDKRAGYLLPVKGFMDAQKKVFKKKQGMYAGSNITGKDLKKKVGKGMGLDDVSAMLDAEKKARAEAYDAVAGYIRDPAEAPNHAEGGMYKERGKEQRTLDRIQEYETEAISQWKNGDPRQSLFTLALALHVAQDIGAHGFGNPGTGHDPRRFFPPPNELAKTAWIFNEKGAGNPDNSEMGIYPDCYFAWCDNKDKNSDGWDIAKRETVRLLTDFNNKVGGEIHEAWSNPNWLKRQVRGAGRFLGGRGIKKHR